MKHRLVAGCASQYCLLLREQAWNLKPPGPGLVLTHCWALRNHTTQVEWLSLCPLRLKELGMSTGWGCAGWPALKDALELIVG